jgi:G3E family GTPase
MRKAVGWMGKEKAEVIVIGGFLGAGKTTLLKRILSWETDLSGTVLIVNEFGKVGIDGSILKSAGADVVELTSGCICCSLKAGLSVTLKRIRQQFNPQRILIETTGVADPASVLEVFRDPELREDMRVTRVITVLEADLWEARDNFGPLLFNQLREADLILLNKIDMVDESMVPQFLNEIHERIPRCRVIPTMYCNADPEILWGDRGLPTFRAQFEAGGPQHEHRDVHDLHLHATSQNGQPDFPFIAFSFQHNLPLDETCFGRFLEELPREVFRVKGLVRFKHRTVLVNYVGGKSEWLDWNGDQETRLAFVGWRADGENTLRRLEDCILSNSSKREEGLES